MYHHSLLAGHQGPYRTAMTIRQKFLIHNLMNKVKWYIEACNTCLKTKPKYKKSRPVYGRIPVDYDQKILMFPNCNNYGVHRSSNPNPTSDDVKLNDKALHQQICTHFKVDYLEEMDIIKQTKR